MKIAFIPSTFLPYVGGAETQTHNVANSLEENNVNVDVYVFVYVFVRLYMLNTCIPHSNV